MKNTAEDILKLLTDDLIAITQQIMITNGVNRDSDLIKSIDIKVVNDSIELVALDYYEYVSTGRRPRARKVPIEDLIAWIKEKRITPRAGQSINSLAFSIQRSIFLSGIRGKKFIQSVERSTLDLLEEEFTMMLSEIITEELKQNIKL